MRVGRGLPTHSKPAFSSRSAAFATAWYGDGLAARMRVARALGGTHSARLVIESFDFAEYSAFHAAEDLAGGNAMIIDAATRLAAFRRRFRPWAQGPETEADRRTAACVAAAWCARKAAV